MDYLEWNDQIAENFFRPEMVGRKVFLYVTGDLINRLGGPRRADVADFVRAVLTGPPWVSKAGLCYRAYEAYANWRSRARDYPPYIAYLALFVLAAGLEGEFAPHAYYPRLRTLIGEDPIIGQYPGFPHMRDLWDDLERWSQEDRQGELGVFNVIFASKWQHVGIPIAQTLLTHEEVEALPTLFVRAALDPTSPPSDDDLASLVRAIGASRLRGRTLRLLAEPERDDNELRDALIEIILDELSSWDGTAPTEVIPAPRAEQPRQVADSSLEPREDQEAEPAANIYAALRLRFKIDRVSGSVQVVLHCRSPHSFPEEGLILIRPATEDIYECDELAAGWSSPLRSPDSGTVVDATNFDWEAGVELIDTSGSWHLRLAGGPVRVLVNGAPYGLDGLVEERRVPIASPFYVAAAEACRTLIEQWGNEACNNFREIRVFTGLPQRWGLFYADRANNDELVRGTYPILALPRSTTLRLEGGIRVGESNKFFTFAPPRVSLSSADDAIELRCNGILLKRTEPAGLFELPVSVGSGVRLVIEAHLGGEAIARKSLYLVDEIEWPGVAANNRFDCYETLAQNVTDYVPVFAGAVVEHLETPALVALPTIDVTRYPRAILLGRSPGQVAFWPRQSLPTEWAPVWAIVMRKRGHAAFCGGDVTESKVSGTDTGDRRLIKKWKQVLWHWRRRIRPPTDPAALMLWKQYQERARDA